MVVMVISRPCWGSEPRPWVGPGKQAKGEVQPRVLHLGVWEPVLMCTLVPTLRSHPPRSRASASGGPQTGDPTCASFASPFVPTLGLMSQLLLASPSLYPCSPAPAMVWKLEQSGYVPRLGLCWPRRLNFSVARRSFGDLWVQAPNCTLGSVQACREGTPGVDSGLSVGLGADQAANP